MLLSLLNRKEKLKFMDLAIYMIAIDGEPTNTEEYLLKKIKVEIGEEIASEYSFEQRDDIDTTIKFFSECNKVVKNIIFLNLFEITMMDDLYNTKEHEFLEKLQNHFGLTASKRREIMEVVYTEHDLREKALRVIKD